MLFPWPIRAAYRGSDGPSPYYYEASRSLAQLTLNKAWHEVPETAPPPKSRPVGYGVIRADVRTESMIGMTIDFYPGSLANSFTASLN
jgi:hypothetical protein